MNTQQKKLQKETIKKVNDAFSKLYVLSHITWTDYRDQLFKMNKADEKKHRGFGNDFNEFHPYAASVSDCAKLFTVKHIAESILKQSKYEVKDLLNMKKSCLYSQAVVENYRDKIVKAWSDQDINFLSNLDYCILVSPEDQLKEKQAA